VDSESRIALVTGGNGFIGSHLIRTLIERGWRVRALVRPSSNLSHLEGLDLEFIRGEFTAPETIRDTLDGSEIVFHLAGITGSRTPERYRQVNVDGSRRFVEACSTIPSLRRFVYISSIAATGPSPDGQLLDEDSPPAPITPYGASKLAGESACLEGLAGACPLTIVRPGIVYGPRDQHVIRFFQMVRLGFMPIRMGDQCLSLIHVEDLASLIELAARLEPAAGRTYLATNPDSVWLRDMTRLIASSMDRRVIILPIPAPLFGAAVGVNWILRKIGMGSALLTRTRMKDFMVRYWTFDSSRARQELGWSPAWTVEEGIRDTAEWYRQNAWL